MRKLTVPKPLQSLTDDQLAQVHSWFSRFTYADMAEKIRQAFNVQISINQLTRYYARFSRAQLFNTVLYTPLTPDDMAALENAEPIPDEINLRRIKEHCLRLAQRQDSRAADLKYFFDIFTYDERRRLKEHRNDLNERNIALRNRLLDLRERCHPSEPQSAPPA